MAGNNKKRKRRTKANSTKPSQTDQFPPDVSTSSNVKMLAEVRDTNENKSFSGLDYISMKKLFKGSENIAAAANILYESSSPIDFNFDLPVDQTKTTKTVPDSKNADKQVTPSFKQFTQSSSLLSKSLSQDANSSNDETLICQQKEKYVPNPTTSDNSNVMQQKSPIEISQPLIEINSPEQNPPKSGSVTPNRESPTNSLADESCVTNSNYELTNLQEQSLPILTTSPQKLISSKAPTPSSPSLLDAGCPLDAAWENENKTPNIQQLDEDLTDCESTISQADSFSNDKPKNSNRLLSPTTGVWRNLSEHESPEPTTSGSRLLSPSATVNEDSISSCDDSVVDPDYEEETDKINTDSSDCEEEHQVDVENSSTDSDIQNMASSTRKRKANPSKWKRNKTKKLRNSGKSYISLKKGNQVAERKIGPTCGQNCRLKCSNKFSEEERQEYFERYWSLEDIDKQRIFISSSMVKIQPKYRYPKSREISSTRKLNHAFYFQNEDTRVRVCKKFFISTLGVTNRCIRTIIDKTREGFVDEDKRGKHSNHVRIPDEVKNGARSHISSIPVVESHYRRADSTRNYIEGGRNLTDIYNDYKNECLEKDKEHVSFSVYRNIFYYEFNLAFFKPKKDMCQFCESYKNMNENEKAEKEEVYKLHHEEKKLSRSEKAEDKEKINEKFIVACFDLEAALPNPRGEISTFYYRSKLSTYNFTICNLNNKGLGSVNCYVWHEGEGHKGANEIASSLLHYLELCSSSQSEDISESTNMIEITFYSDNCGGQGKNKFIIAAYLYAVANLNIKSITHKFLVVGHTQNEGDVVHSLIERNIKKALKAGPIYIPSQYSTLISTARKSGEPFRVHEIDHEFFFDFKDLVAGTSTNFNVNSRGEKFNFNNICVIKVEKDRPGIFLYKTSYKDTDFKVVEVARSRTRKSITQFKDVELQKAYADSIPISTKKYQDLQFLVNSNVIPRCHSTFFSNLKHE